MQAIPPAEREALRAAIFEVEAKIAAALERAQRPKGAVRLVAVTKSVQGAVIRALYEYGLRDFGENRPERLAELAQAFAAEGPRWHMIGTYQRRKIRDTLAHCHLVHAVDTLPLLAAIAARSASLAEPPQVLLQVNVSGAPNKHGFAPSALPEALEFATKTPTLAVLGLMTMAEPDDDERALRATFGGLRELRDRHRQGSLPLPELSMGMSNDFEIAVEEGATLVRIGSRLFEGISEAIRRAE